MTLIHLSVEIPQTCAIGEVAGQLCALADRINVVVSTRLRGTTILVYPGETPREHVEKFTEAELRGRKLSIVSRRK